MTTAHCFATVQTTDGDSKFIHWTKPGSISSLKKKLRQRYKNDGTVKYFRLGNGWTVNSYGAH